MSALGNASQFATLAPTALHGALLGGSLIVAIGAQNAFVLRQGLRREHIGAVVVFCALADALLMALGIFGLAGAMAQAPALSRALAAAGMLFLLAYGALAWRRALRPGALLPADAPPQALGRVLAQCAAFTLLNPHVYLDTVLLVGSVGAQQGSAVLRLAFWVGAALASFVWFASIGLGARALAPVLARPLTWRVLDGLIGAVMFVIAWQLLPFLLGHSAA